MVTRNRKFRRSLESCAFGLTALVGLFLAARGTRAEENAPPSAAAPSDAEPAADVYLPGSPKPYGLGLSPEAPIAGPTIGGRAPSFGAPTERDEWTFRMSGRIAAFEVAGLGSKPNPAVQGYSGKTLHVPALIQGRQPFWPFGGFTLYATYGNPIVQANVSYYASMPGQEFRGYYNPFLGPTMGQAYMTITPPAFGKMQFQAKVGAFTELYGGVGQWGWGIFGPLLGVRGYGEVMSLQYDANPDVRLTFSHGLNAVPGITEATPRGDYVPWTANGISSFVQHAHAAINYKSNYTARLHAAQVNGTNDQQFLYKPTMDTTILRDGRIRALILELRAMTDPYGSFAAAGALYSLKHALSVNDGMWWGVDWTQGGREMVNKFLGAGTSAQGGNGKIGVLSAQWDFSLARIMWYPRNFDGRSPDLRAHVAALKYFTLDADAPVFRNASGQVIAVDKQASFKGTGGYQIGTELEYVLLSWFGLILSAYGEDRYMPPNRTLVQRAANGNYLMDPSNPAMYAWAQPESLGPWRVYSITPGIQFRSDWNSLDAITIAYSRRFYTRSVDNNTAQPLDRNVFTLGAWFGF